MNKKLSALVISVLIFIFTIQLSYLIRLDLKLSRIALTPPSIPDYTQTNIKDNVGLGSNMQLIDQQTSISMTELKEFLRGEIRNLALSNNLDHRENKQPYQPEQKVTEQALQHFSQTNNILDQAIARGSWEHADYEAVLPLLKDLTQEQRTQLALKFSDSINNQQIDFSSIESAILPPF